MEILVVAVIAGIVGFVVGRATARGKDEPPASGSGNSGGGSGAPSVKQ